MGKVHKLETGKSSQPSEGVELTGNALKVLERRYLKKDDAGRPMESPEDMFRRVAVTIAQGEAAFSNGSDPAEVAERFYRLMTSLKFLPNSPTLMNAGRPLGQLSACFVLPVEDSMEEIFEAVKHTSVIHKTGGGTGFSFSRLRPRDDVVASTKGVSSGPISFMTVFNAATETIKQGGMRRGANMAVLNVDHPDVLDFINCKHDTDKLNNFNISVGLNEAFIRAVDADESYPLLNPRGRKVVRLERAREVFDKIVASAWKNGEPGILFLDRINRDNPTPALGAIESTNPCGEQPLLPYESCNLGSLNLARMVRDGEVAWDEIAEHVRTGVRFLDNVIEMNTYPLPQIEATTRANRKIGLGVMGFADLLIQLEIPYDSEEAVVVAERVMGFINEEAVRASEALAEVRGAFKNFDRSVFAEKGLPARRNATCTTIAPTGTLSLIAGCSSGIEPLFALAQVKNVMDAERLEEVHPLFMQVARREGFYSEALLEKILATGSAHGLEEVPERWQRIFVTAHDVSPEWHLRIQAAFQNHTQNSVSKTVNFPADATPEDVRRVFRLAYDLGCKGVTIYRDGSRDQQVIEKGVGGKAAATALAVQGESSASASEHIAPRPRPFAMQGCTYKMETSCGSLFVTVSVDGKGAPFELFCNMGKAGACASSQTEALGRLVSLSLRSGLQPKQIVKQLRGIHCHLPRGFGPNRISSCADGVAQALESFWNEGVLTNGAGPIPAGADTRSPQKGDAPFLTRGACPECNGPIAYEGGCSHCLACGHSDCS